MARFFLGFLVATVLYGAAAVVLSSQGRLSFGAPPAPAAVAAAEDPDVEADPKKPKRPKKTPSKPRTSAGVNATTGDNLDWDGERQVDMNGAEGQLTGTQIEAGFDSAMSKIRRCLVLVDSDGDITGKLIFGMKVGSDGTPRAVNLSGPAVVTTGDSGDCLRKAAQGIKFAKFSGPDTLFKYPITLQ